MLSGHHPGAEPHHVVRRRAAAVGDYENFPCHRESGAAGLPGGRAVRARFELAKDCEVFTSFPSWGTRPLCDLTKGARPVIQPRAASEVPGDQPECFTPRVTLQRDDRDGRRFISAVVLHKFRNKATTLLSAPYRVTVQPAPCRLQVMAVAGPRSKSGWVSRVAAEQRMR